MKKLYALATAIAVFSTSGCIQVGTTVSTEDGYYTEQRMSEIEYDTFIAKKTSVILDKLAAHAACSTNIANGEMDHFAEADNVEVTIDAVKEAYQDIKAIGASIDREKGRENLLSQLEDVEEHLNDYRSYLLTAQSIDCDKMTEFASTFKNDFTTIKAF